MWAVPELLRILAIPVTPAGFRTNKKVQGTTGECQTERDCMPGNGSNAEPESWALERAARIRAAVEEAHEPLLRSLAVLVAKTERHLAWSAVMEIASELLNEAVQQALKHAHRFDPQRSVTAWVRGISARLLLMRRRTEARGRRCVPATVLGTEAWEAALEQYVSGSAESAVSTRLDLEQALGRLLPEERRAIELRYYCALDGDELASALGVPTSGAARVRVCRALQSLRAHFRPAHEEVES
jgi:RNA polymerase sigma factor (sigma-70 family)